MADLPPLHPDLVPLSGLLGEWEGPGHGVYPTIDAFDYIERVRFTHVGKPFLWYEQRTRHADTGLALHAESGFWRVVDTEGEGHRLEVVLAHPTGIAEITEGEWRNDSVTLRSVSVARSTTAVEVDDLERYYDLGPSHLHYRLAMAAVGQPLTHHLEASLTRLS